MTLRDLQEQSYALAAEKGWTERPVEVPEQVALICSEACEALEAWRHDRPLSYMGPGGKPEGVGAEYADILIRVGHYAQLLGIDLDAEVARKLAYNRTRPHRHGALRG